MVVSAHGLSYVKREPKCGNTAHPPALILLHGYALYENHLFELAQGFDPRLLIVSVRAPIRIGPGSYRWFHFDYYGTIAQRPSGGPTINVDEEAKSLAALTAFLDGFAAERAPDRVYLLGHSQGGTMALSVALTRPWRISGCAQAHGRILPTALAALTDRKSLSGLPFFVGHGVDNPIVPITLGRATRRRLQDLQVNVSYREYPVGHEMTPDILADMSDWLSARLDEAA